MGYGRRMRFLGVLSLLMTSLQAFQGKPESYGDGFISRFQTCMQYIAFSCRTNLHSNTRRRCNFRLKYCYDFILLRKWRIWTYSISTVLHHQGIQFVKQSLQVFETFTLMISISHGFVLGFVY